MKYFLSIIFIFVIIPALATEPQISAKNQGYLLVEVESADTLWGIAGELGVDRSNWSEFFRTMAVENPELEGGDRFTSMPIGSQLKVPLTYVSIAKGVDISKSQENVTVKLYRELLSSLKVSFDMASFKISSLWQVLSNAISYLVKTLIIATIDMVSDVSKTVHIALFLTLSFWPNPSELLSYSANVIGAIPFREIAFVLLEAVKSVGLLVVFIIEAVLAFLTKLAGYFRDTCGSDLEKCAMEARPLIFLISFTNLLILTGIKFGFYYEKESETELGPKQSNEPGESSDITEQISAHVRES